MWQQNPDFLTIGHKLANFPIRVQENNILLSPFSVAALLDTTLNTVLGLMRGTHTTPFRPAYLKSSSLVSWEDYQTLKETYFPEKFGADYELRDSENYIKHVLAPYYGLEKIDKYFSFEYEDERVSLIPTEGRIDLTFLQSFGVSESTDIAVKEPDWIVFVCASKNEPLSSSVLSLMKKNYLSVWSF